MKFWSFSLLFLLFLFTREQFFFFFFLYVGELVSGNNFFSSVEILPKNSVVFDVDPHIEIIFDRHHQTHQSWHLWPVTIGTLCFTISAYFWTLPLAPHEFLSIASYSDWMWLSHPLRSRQVSTEGDAFHEED